jgi:hypothetical protein
MIACLSAAYAWSRRLAPSRLVAARAAAEGVESSVDMVLSCDAAVSTYLMPDSKNKVVNCLPVRAGLHPTPATEHDERHGDEVAAAPTAEHAPKTGSGGGSPPRPGDRRLSAGDRRAEVERHRHDLRPAGIPITDLTRRMQANGCA